MNEIETLRERNRELNERLEAAERVLRAAAQVGEIRFKTCVLSAQVADQIDAWLAAPVKPVAGEERT